MCIRDRPDAQSQTSVIADVQQLHDLIKGVHPITVFAVDLRVDQSFLLIKAHCVDAQYQHCLLYTSYIRKHDFTAFGWYRIVLGAIVLLYFGIFA